MPQWNVGSVETWNYREMDERGNFRAVQLSLGRIKLKSTVRYLGIEVDDAIEIAEQTEV